MQLLALFASRPARLAALAVVVAGAAVVLREPEAIGAEPSAMWHLARLRRHAPVPIPSPAPVGEPKHGRRSTSSTNTGTTSLPGSDATPSDSAVSLASGPVRPTRTSGAVSSLPGSAADVAEERPRGHTPASWPAGPEPLPGALLPNSRIVAFYGNPYSKRMGILGELPRDSMMAQLRATAAEWAAADSSVEVKPALHLIATVAQGLPGRDGMHRLRMPDSLIQQVAGWAEANHWLLFLDVQVGQSTVQRELPRLLPYLARPYVHLALDPEFSMKDGSAPGTRIGTLDAEDVNYAVRALEALVDSLKLPPKVLIVHRFTQRMLTNSDRITVDPRVQVVIDMDGFGDRPLKRSVYRDFVVKQPVQYTGFKLFYKNDRPMMTPAEVLSLSPVPLYIQYQ
ncbi:MAG TPA: hypothetical protein VK688_07415 [Gemmatimonadales bacterium]|nr:hypothetical protein [Gemmatimonadales bacterium]